MFETATATPKRSLTDLIGMYQELEEQILAAGGELSPEIETALAENQEAIEAKLDGYAGMIGYLKGQADYLKREGQQYTDRARTLANAVESMRERMVFAMTATGQDKVKTLAHSYSLRITESWQQREDTLTKVEFEKLVNQGLAKLEFKLDIKALKDECGGVPPEYIEVVPKVSINIR
jgi:hypothetical protein